MKIGEDCRRLSSYVRDEYESLERGNIHIGILLIMISVINNGESHQDIQVGRHDKEVEDVQ